MAKTVLLIDDNPADRRLTEKLLRSSFRDLRLGFVGDALGFQALRKENLPDLVICEAELHWAKGEELARELQTLDPLLPIIFLCSPLHAGREEALLAVEPADLLVKSSFSYLSLPKRVLSVLRRSELLRSQASGQPDSHELKRLSERLATLERSNEDLRNFASVAAHQLKEPLRMVEHFTKIVNEDFDQGLDPRAREYLQFANEGARRMSQLVDDLLRFSRADSEAQDFQVLDANRIVRSAIENLQMSLDEVEAQVRVDDLPKVIGDESQLIQVFQNLLENAVKFRHLQRNLEVRISCTRKDRLCCFSMEDNGIGIPPEKVESIFETFKRLDTRSPGSGLGLSITRRIVERHGGKIWAKSRVGEGTIFCLTLPCQSEKLR